MKLMLKSQIIAMHKALISAYGGTDGIRDEALLDSAINAPFQSFDGQSAFPTLQQKAARLGYGLIMNHPFVDGNKRIGAHVMLTFLELNGVELKYTQAELYEIILRVAANEAPAEELLRWILQHET